VDPEGGDDLTTVGGTSEPGRRRGRWRAVAVLALGFATVGWSDDIARDGTTATRRPEAVHPSPARLQRPLRGLHFPDGLLALTWDDGPDLRTVELARYLHEQSVGGTFFVVGEWLEGMTDEPGIGAAVATTGYAHLPILGELVRLGHRIGNHTRNHVLLGDAPIATVHDQLLRTAHELDPFLGGEVRLFRAPGGSWSENASSALADPLLATLVGPVHWDIDAKDWDASLACRSGAPPDCEAGPLGPRVKPSVVAARYLAQIETQRRGIVLFHDRVGDVGSGYAVDLARRLVPALRARGFVFAAPVLAFSPLEDRLMRPHEAGADTVVERSRAILADIDGDGRADLCERGGSTLHCARAQIRKSASTMPRASFAPPEEVLRFAAEGGDQTAAFGDVDGDGRADLCVADGDGVRCAIDPSHHDLRRWSRGKLPGDRSTWKLADVDGDGRADACFETEAGLFCRASDGKEFGPARVWSARRRRIHPLGLALADVDGDRRADLCERSDHGVDCALSTGLRFGDLERWSAGEDFAVRPAAAARGAGSVSDDDGRLLLGDLNGDGRADACIVEGEDVRCALSRGHGFLAATVWTEAPPSGAAVLGDVNGDGRADLCWVGRDRIACGIAP
jgi:peptidoglycan/xylan/chitin deacetylase (PgdA/CDA1 family)